MGCNKSGWALLPLTDLSWSG